MQNLFFAFEVEIDGAISDISGAGDVGDLGIKVAVTRKDFGGGSQDKFTLGFRSVSCSFRAHKELLNESSLSNAKANVSGISAQVEKRRLARGQPPEKSPPECALTQGSQSLALGLVLKAAPQLQSFW